VFVLQGHGMAAWDRDGGSIFAFRVRLYRDIRSSSLQGEYVCTRARVCSGCEGEVKIQYAWRQFSLSVGQSWPRRLHVIYNITYTRV